MSTLLRNSRITVVFVSQGASLWPFCSVAKLPQETALFFPVDWRYSPSDLCYPPSSIQWKPG